MDQDQQENRHVCRFCNKSFSNGKVLGGHMRCHVAKNPKKLAKKRTAKSNTIITTDDDNNNNNNNNNKSYGLRVNPKKSSRVSPVSNDQEAASMLTEIPCRVCDKVFDSARALFGHMRHHSTNKPKKEPLCRQAKSREVEGLIGEKLFVEASGFAKRKRSRRSRYKVSASGLADCSVLNSSLDSDREVEEIALSLLMLSNGVRGLDELCSAKKSRVDLDSGLGIDFLDDKKLSQFSENDDIRVEKESDDLDQDCVFGQLCWSDSERRIGYKCKTCDKTFHSHQALGGHQTIHRPNKAYPIGSQSGDFSVISEDFVEFEAERASVQSCDTKEHKCHLCFKVFGSGQALGGHKRAHMVKDSEVEADQIALVNNQESCGISGHGIDSDGELKSPWWVMNNHKHELLVGLVPN